MIQGLSALLPILNKAVSLVPDKNKIAQQKADLEKDDIDLFIFHQASAVILRQLKLKLNIPDEKWFQNIKNMGNTVSATIPIAIKRSIDSGLYKPNMKIMLMGFGVGLSVAGCIIRS